MDDKNEVDEEVVPTATKEKTDTESDNESDEQDLLKTELDKVQSKGRTKVEKLQYTKKRIDEQLKELGVQDEPEEDEDDKPLTRGEFKKLQAQTATKTALDLADGVTSITERELLKYHLENTIRSTGNPQEDFKLAQGLVNSVKNSQILEETLRKPNATTHTSGSGAPAKKTQQVEFTDEELKFMRAPFNLTKEEVIAARPK
jgi:hypothetical protein